MGMLVVITVISVIAVIAVIVCAYVDPAECTSGENRYYDEDDEFVVFSPAKSVSDPDSGEDEFYHLV
jgi:hypothetical protein